jgi:hypothetical protein
MGHLKQSKASRIYLSVWCSDLLSFLGHSKNKSSHNVKSINSKSMPEPQSHSFLSPFKTAFSIIVLYIILKPSLNF